MIMTMDLNINHSLAMMFNMFNMRTAHCYKCYKDHLKSLKPFNKVNALMYHLGISTLVIVNRFL